VIICAGLYLGLTKNRSWFLYIAILDLVAATLLNLPFTGTGMRSTKDIHNLISASPKGFPAPSMAPEPSYIDSYPDTDKVIGNWSMYSKNIGVKNWYPYPIVFSGSESYFNTDHGKLYGEGTSFIFSSGDPSKIRLVDFRPHLIRFENNRQESGTVVIKQNIYPGWDTRVDGAETHPDTAYSTFPAIRLASGRHMVQHEFKKPMVKLLFVIYSVLFCLILMYVIIASGTFSRNRS
jgi:hypothetical protein